MSPQKVSKARAESSDKTIQYIGVAVILMVIGTFAWRYIPKSQSFTVDKSPACKPFADIPAADQYQKSPDIRIDTAKNYSAHFNMENGGEFNIQLYSNLSPITVNNFVFLACQGFYNSTTFHRVIDGFMAQGGDPTGSGSGGPGYTFADESNGLVFNKAGLIAMANSGPDTNGSQFFITFAPAEHLNGKHTIFGEVTSGMDVVNAINRRDPNANPTFEGDKIESITISVE